MATQRKSGRRSSGTSPDASEMLVLELQSIHSAESQLSRLIPRLSKAADSEALKKCLDTRLSQGERLIGEVESALEELEASPGRKKNVAAAGLIDDTREHVQEIDAGPALDATLIASLQKTEHYCIAAWGTAKALGQALGQKSVVQAMERALDEGKELDQQLTDIAESELTPAMLSQGSEEEEDEESESTTSRSGQANGRSKGKSQPSASR